MSIHHHQPTSGSLLSLFLSDQLFSPSRPTQTRSSSLSSIVARTFFSAPDAAATRTTAVETGSEARLLERATDVLSKRSSSPSSSSPSSSRSERGENHSKDAGGGGAARDKNTVAEALIELGVTLGIALVSSYLLSLLTKRFLKGYLPGEQEDGDVPASSVYAKLRRILQKRADLMQGDGATATGAKATIIDIPHLTPRELQMADEILDPDEIESSFADIGGLDATKQEIYELAVLPLVRPGTCGRCILNLLAC